MNNTPTIIDDKTLAKKLKARDTHHRMTATDPHHGEGTQDPRDYHAAAAHLIHDGEDRLPKNHGEESQKINDKIIEKGLRALRKDIHKMRDAGKARGVAKSQMASKIKSDK
jgi:hypothetical protein